MPTLSAPSDTEDGSGPGSYGSVSSARAIDEPDAAAAGDPPPATPSLPEGAAHPQAAVDVALIRAVIFVG
jgi:hypothetical protein